MSLLTELTYTFKPDKPCEIIKEWAHIGIVASGDMEVLVEKKNLDGYVKFNVVTKVKGFDELWEKVLEKFVNDTGVCNAVFSINDNAATPAVVLRRLQQVMGDAGLREGVK